MNTKLLFAGADLSPLFPVEFNDRMHVQAQQLSERDQALAQRDALLQRKDREIALREAKIEKINFELARLKRWTYGAKSETHECRPVPRVRGNAGGGRTRPA